MSETFGCISSQQWMMLIASKLLRVDQIEFALSIHIHLIIKSL